MNEEAEVFSCEFCEIFTNTFFTEHLWTTASVTWKELSFHKATLWFTFFFIYFLLIVFLFNIPIMPKRKLHLKQPAVWIINEMMDKKRQGRNNSRLYSAKFVYTWLYLINVTVTHSKYMYRRIILLMDSSSFSQRNESLNFLENQPLFET